MYDPYGNRYNYNDPPPPPPRRPVRSVSPMAIAAIVCAVISLFCIMTGIFALIFGSLAIVFAFLSKGSRPRPERVAVYARFIGFLAAAIGAVLIIYSVFVAIDEYGSLENFYYSYLESVEQSYNLDLGTEENP